MVVVVVVVVRIRARIRSCRGGGVGKQVVELERFGVATRWFLDRCVFILVMIFRAVHRSDSSAA